MSTEAAAVATVTVTKGVWAEVQKWYKSYNAEQSAQMKRIHTLYSKELQLDPDDAKCEFKMKNGEYTEPEWRPEDMNFDIDAHHKELKPLQNRPLTKHIRQILPKITNWQQERMKKILTPPRNDPVNLIMEEFKRWLIHAAVAELKIVAKEIQQRIRYVVGLQQAEEFDDSVRAGFLILEQGLQRRLYPEVMKKLSQQGVQEFIEELINKCTNLVLDGIQFAFYVLRSNKKSPKTLSIDDVRLGTSRRDVECMETRTGLLLWALSWSPSVQYLRPPLIDEYPLTLPPEFKLKEIPKLETVVDEEKKVPLFIDEKGDPMIPELLIKKLTPKEKAKIKKMVQEDPQAQVTAYFDKGEAFTGISKAFSTKAFGAVERRRLLREFVLFHGLLHKIVDFVLVCKDIQRVAKIASELLLYGIAKEEVLNTMLLGSMLLGNLMKCARKLYDTSAQRAFEVDPKHKEWRGNRLQAVPMFYALIDKINECTELCQQVDKNASRDFEEIVKEAKQQSALMISHARAFYKQNSFLGIELDEPKLLEPAPTERDVFTIESSSTAQIMSASSSLIASAAAGTLTGPLMDRRSFAGAKTSMALVVGKETKDREKDSKEREKEVKEKELKEKEASGGTQNIHNLPICEFGMKCEMLKPSHPAHQIHLKRFYHNAPSGIFSKLFS